MPKTTYKFFLIKPTRAEPWMGGANGAVKSLGVCKKIFVCAIKMVKDVSILSPHEN